MPSTWTLYSRDPAGARAAQLDDIAKATLTPRFNDVGEWTIDVPLNVARRAGLTQRAALPGLSTPRWGIEFEVDGKVVLSGPSRVRRRSRSGNVDLIHLEGVSDDWFYDGRLCHPQPATASPPYSTSAYRVVTGPASTVMIDLVNVNAGPGALGPRQIPGLALAADPAAGAVITGRTRWHNLLIILRYIGLISGVGFRTRGLTFEVYQPADRSASVKFSPELGTLADFDYREEDPEANYVYVGGGGEGTARVVVERQDAASIVEYGRREVFRDRRDTTDSTELLQAGLEELVDKGARSGMSLSPIQTQGLRWPRDYDLGDIVTVVVDGVPIVDRVQELRLEIDGKGLDVAPVVGVPELLRSRAAFTELQRRLDRRLTNLENA